MTQRPMLLMSVMIVLLSSAESNHDAVQRVSYADLMSVFKQIAGTYHQQKTVRNSKMDKHVLHISQQIDSIIPELQALGAYVHNFSSAMPLLKASISEPVASAKKTLKQAVAKLIHCTAEEDSPPSLLHDTDDSSYEADNHTSHIGHTESQELDENSSSDEGGPAGTTVSALLSQAMFDESSLNTILSKFDSDSVVALSDAAKAFKVVADKFSQEHLNRFQKLSHHVKNVKDTVDSIIKYVKTEKDQLADVSFHASSFLDKSVTCLSDVNNLATRALKIASDMC